MKNYRFLVVKYKPIAAEKPMINIGVIIQGEGEIDCKFNKDLTRVTNFIGPENIDKMIFENLEDTFKTNFQSGSFWITNKDTGAKREIKYTDPFYLDYLTTNLLNNYYFNNKGQLEAKNIQEGLVRLYRTFIDPSY